MKKLASVLILLLALNFLAVAGGIGWLAQGGHLDREKIAAIKEILFPKPAEEKPTTQPDAADSATTQPTLRLEELLTKVAGRPASDQVQYIQSTFDQNRHQLDLKQGQLNDLQHAVDLAKEQLAKDRQALLSQQKLLETREKQATKLASDKGFQDSLALYNTMPAKQVKGVFMGMDDQTVLNYLQAMQPRTAAKIVKEFKSPEEADRIQKILKRLSPIAQASIKE